MHLSANLSMLFTEVPMAERFGPAARAGFGCVEIQFPGEDDLEEIAAASRSARLPVTLINVPRGEADEVGLAALPGRERDFQDALSTCLRQASLLAAHKVNVLAGRPPADATRADCLACLVDNLRRAGDLFGEIDVAVMLEPINTIDVPGFFLSSLELALEAIERSRHDNVCLQFDLYHMSLTEADLVAAIEAAGPRIGHVQFADAPGRHEPGSGTIDFAAAFDALRRVGYEGAVAAEYRPAAATAAGLSWVPAFREMLWIGATGRPSSKAAPHSVPPHEAPS